MGIYSPCKMGRGRRKVCNKYIFEKSKNISEMKHFHKLIQLVGHVLKYPWYRGLYAASQFKK